MKLGVVGCGAMIDFSASMIQALSISLCVVQYTMYLVLRLVEPHPLPNSSIRLGHMKSSAISHFETCMHYLILLHLVCTHVCRMYIINAQMSSYLHQTMNDGRFSYICKPFNLKRVYLSLCLPLVTLMTFYPCK